MPKSPMSYEALASPHTSTIWRTVLPSHHAGPRLTENIKCFQERLISWLSFQREYISIFSIWRSTTVWSTGAPDCAGDFGDFGNHDSHLIQMLVRSLIHNTIHFTFAWYNYSFDTRGMQHCFSVGGEYNTGFHNKYCKIWYSNVLQTYYNPRWSVV